MKKKIGWPGRIGRFFGAIGTGILTALAFTFETAMAAVNIEMFNPEGVSYELTKAARDQTKQWWNEMKTGYKNVPEENPIDKPNLTAASATPPSKTTEDSVSLVTGVTAAAAATSKKTKPQSEEVTKPSAPLAVGETAAVVGATTAMTKPKGASNTDIVEVSKAGSQNELKTISDHYHTFMRSTVGKGSPSYNAPPIINNNTSIQLSFPTKDSKKVFLHALASEGKKFIAKDLKSSAVYYSDGKTLHSFKNEDEFQKHLLAKPLASNTQTTKAETPTTSPPVEQANRTLGMK
ncbi:hypothetical protein [Legionella impletisoli]|uniref:Uncharacterized protein n=1 Tax=Legionella impletisoli TaxID=343510 RepID=A0A917NC13_9GAMM|nr:hypothetical protein [Legionella impletisoli]GGI82353.1 hypothetical protein GCM10007966_08640 [Legionella impletisoli]